MVVLKVKKVLSQGIINTGPTRSVASADESSPGKSSIEAPIDTRAFVLYTNFFIPNKAVY